MYSQPSKSFCGGCAIYVNSQLDHQVRNDLSVLEAEYETIWVEINNTEDKNVLCCCLYRHPSSDINKFIDHMTSILQKVQKEKKPYSLWVISTFICTIIPLIWKPMTSLIEWYLIIFFLIFYIPPE